MSTKPLIYVVGGGSIGVVMAALHARAGYPTVLVVRTQEQKARLAGGLKFFTQEQAQAPALQAQPQVAVWADCPPFPPHSRVYLCCKIFQLEEVLFEVRSRASAETPIIFMQNGLGVIEEAERSMLLSPHWQRAICWFGVKAWKTGKAGEYELCGAPVVELGGSRPDELVETAAHFRDAGVTVQFEGPVAQAEWRKALWNLSVNPVGALAQAPNGQMADVPGLRQVSEAAMKEAMQVGKALGVFLGKEDAERVFEGARASGTNWNSMLQDLWAGRPTEIDWLNGYVVREGRRLGLATPVNEALVGLIKYLEEKNVLKRAPAPST
jgi:2-dehydropantoate 2-reductase